MGSMAANHGVSDNTENKFGGSSSRSRCILCACHWQATEKATKGVMVTATRVVGNEESDGDGNGNKVGNGNDNGGGG